VQAQSGTTTGITRSLASLLAAPVIAFAAFIGGLAVTTAVMAAWDSDAVFVLCFGTAFLAGLFVITQLSRTLGRAGEYTFEAVVRGTLAVYFLSAVTLSFVLVGIISDLRGQ
jgi:undecaprenyl pyrophosphate phosphatase UppP